MIDSYFEEALTAEYNLFKKAVPHHDTLQNKVAECLLSTINTPNPILLEIGGGNGETYKCVRKLYPYATIYILEPDKDMYDILSKYYAADNDTHILCTDAVSYLKTCEKDMFDGIYSAWTIHNIYKNERRKIYKYIHTALKTDGLFVNGDKIVDSITLHNDLYKQILLFEKVFYNKYKNHNLYKNWVSHYLKDMKTQLLLTDTDYKKELTHIHFRDIQCVYKQLLESVWIARK